MHERKGMKAPRGILILSLVIFLAPLAGSRAAAPTDATGKSGKIHRNCRPGDLVGLWQVVKWTSYIGDNREKLNSYADPHQWYWFMPDGSLKSMSSNKPHHHGVREALAKTPAVITYNCNSSGLVTTQRKDLSNASELWAASYVTADTSDAVQNVSLKKGDVVMTLIGKDNKVLYVRQMRKLNSE